MKDKDMRLIKKELTRVINQQKFFGSRLVGKKMFVQIIKELCEYKDIEEELGINLITLFKALKYGVYYFPIGIQELERDCVYLMDNDMSVGPREQLSYSFITVFERQILSLNDYG